MTRSVGQTLEIVVLGPTGAGKTALLNSLSIQAKNNNSTAGSAGLLFTPSANSKIAVDLPVQFHEIEYSDSTNLDPKWKADGLILILDASSDVTHLEQRLSNLVDLLGTLQSRRQDQFLVGGFPIGIVLTKCDLLADTLMSYSEWMQRIENRKETVRKLFDENYSLADDGGFGSLCVEIYTTSTHLPDVTDKVKQRDEPFGIRPLAQDLFETAYFHREEASRSNLRLARAVFTSAVALALLLLGVGVLVVTQTSDVQLALEAKVDGFQAREGQTASSRLAGAQLSKKRSELLELRNDPEFEQLARDKQNYIAKHLEEIEAYIQLRDDLARLSQPVKTRSLDDLNRLEESLKNLSLPKTFEKDWAQTEVVQAREKYLSEIPTLRTAVTDARQFFSRLKNRGNELLFVTELTPEWDSNFRKLQVDSNGSPFASGDRLKLAALDFREVEVLRSEWNRALEKLRTIQELAVTLGILGNPSDNKSLLLLSESDLQSRDPLRMISDRLTRLKRDYPGVDNWSLTAIPDNLRPQFQSRWVRANQLAIQFGQQMLLDQLKSINPTGPEKTFDWPKLAEWLNANSERDLREYLHILHRIGQPTREDLCDHFSRFAATASFSLNPKSFRLFIPDALREFRIRPAGKLTINHRPSGSDKTTTWSFREDGDGVRDKNGISYLFALESNGSPISYSVGDLLWAELPLKEGEKNWQFSWLRSRTTSFQFERLLREPRFHDPIKGANSGEWAEGVKMILTEGSLPSVPELLPIVHWP
ncbi:hypothetical protein KIH39_04020 [Telmatocola sphagniphila]|uniref:Uncharacterized protein n=1 Tax=Telmatocola sphagniphila TaxID=1123043 RepID=A0A8E6B7C8_9BACT|nr:hypothetical protein [Telmatocola sphagniphila]QVL33091.1 hypothetical protein KIH39_04020 [Telmatocola sphagniphila]